MSHIKERLLSIGIAIILVLFIGYGIDTFYKSPEFEDYCAERPQSMKTEYTQEECNALDGEWNERPCPEEAEDCTPMGFCNVYEKCEKELDSVRDIYNRNVFFIAVVLGFAALITGLILKLDIVSGGLMGGGILSILYGTLRYWEGMGEYLRFIILGIILITLIWIAYKKFRK